VWYVSIAGVTDEFLEILGFSVVEQDDVLKTYRDYYGQVQYVSRKRPYLLVADANDRESIVARSTSDRVIAAPPKPTQ
jgi:hypothetical protein